MKNDMKMVQVNNLSIMKLLEIVQKRLQKTKSSIPLTKTQKKTIKKGLI